MIKPVLVVMAAGLGSRFNGLKQIESVDDCNHVLIDYSIYDAIEAGFEEIVFIIRKDFEKQFKEIIGNRIEKKVSVKYVYQSFNDVPVNINLPKDRVKPLGTTHAIWSARKLLKNRKFLTINADDFYGRSAYKLAYNFLIDDNTTSKNHACICYRLENTLSLIGSVNRGICEVDKNNKLIKIDECKNIKLKDNKCIYNKDMDDIELSKNSLASMNLWAFSESFIDDIEISFKERFKNGILNNPYKFEETISEAVQSILDRNIGDVTCILTEENWFGMTYSKELIDVKNKLKQLNYMYDYER